MGVFKRTSQTRKNHVLVIGDDDQAGGVKLVNETVFCIDRKTRPEIKRLGSSKGKLVLTDNEMSKEYSQALVTICASHNEPFGLASVESMACQTPVLAVNEGGFKETVVDEKTGYLLKRDAKLFADKLNISLPLDLT